jgi:hypothetical protein
MSNNVDERMLAIVKATLELNFQHWLQHGTPVNPQDAAQIALDVRRMVAPEHTDLH